jgi:hypothetical protein
MKRLTMRLPALVALAFLAACSGVQMPTLQMPSAQLPTAQMPSVNMPSVQAPSVNMPQVPNMPTFNAPSVSGLPTADEAAGRATQSTKEALRNIKSDKKPVVTHSFVGRDDQTVAEIRQSCVIEATQKLAQVVGTDVRTTVLDNEVITLRGRVVANCRLAVQE